MASMFPQSLSLFGFSLPLYGVFLSVAHLVGLSLLLHQAKRWNKPVEQFVDLAFFVAVSGLVGARLGYIYDHSQEFLHWKDWIDLNKGGLSFFFGFAFAFPVYLAVLKWKKMPIWETSDFITPILPVSLGILRLGCFSAGCCYGTSTTLPWGVINHFSGAPLSLQEAPLHPVQIYEAAFLFFVAGMLFYLPKRWKIPTGAKASGFLFVYSSFRISSIPLRGDIQAGPLGIPSLYLTSGLLMIVSLGILLFLYRKDPISTN
jgi:phosphatidylglycerol:prolipoprotein diacylglycerol transferase